MNRRRLLQHAAAIPLLPSIWRQMPAPASAQATQASQHLPRVRPGDPAWPSPASWAQLSGDVGGRLVKVESPLGACRQTADSAACDAIFKKLKNPYFIGDEAALTQTSGWLDAWTSAPSVYAVAARNTEDIVQPSTLRTSTACGWSSKAAATAIRARPTRPTRFSSGHGA